MFNSVALDVVIGLIFIYLLYSLLATVLAEIIATMLGIRARNLKEAVDRMLTDEKECKTNHSVFLWIWDKICRIGDSLRLMKNPKNPIIKKFYNNPEIKYLGSTGIFKNPSSFKAETFSRTLLYELNGSGKLDKSNIENELEALTKPTAGNPNPPNPGVSNNQERTLDIQSAQFVLSLFHSSNGDLIKFKIHLEAWFDRTMEQATEWYKRKLQIILLVLGFFMAWFFNADSFALIKKLSTDKDAREKMVNMASAYLQNNKTIVETGAIKDSAELQNYQQKLDSLFEIKKKLDADINKANTLLGIGAWLPDSVQVIKDKNGKKTYLPEIDLRIVPEHCLGKVSSTGFISAEHIQFNYFWKLPYYHFFGFLITAIAISLGAPFWFDLLNKLMALRTSIKQDTNSAESNSNSTVSPLNRVG